LIGADKGIVFGDFHQIKYFVFVSRELRGRFITFRALCLLLALSIAGCDTTVPQVEPLNYKARAETKTEGGVTVSASVVSPEETDLAFSLPLTKRNIQPVWIAIENRTGKEFYLVLISIDPNYYSPAEVAWQVRDTAGAGSSRRKKLDQLIKYFVDQHVPVIIPAGASVSGFVFTNLDPGRKAYSVEVIGQGEAHSFEFVQAIPGFEADYSNVDIQGLYAPDKIRDLNLDQLRRYLEELPCCVSGPDNKRLGDPLNLVVVGRGDLVLATLARRDWDLTESTRPGTVGRTVLSSIFRSNYRTSPVSPLYLFDRKQDAALQKVRGTLGERNHMRLWRAPVNLNGEPVWVGQISRDIGTKLSSVTLVTHKIDPVVDEARLYVTMDVIASQSLGAIGFVSGVGFSDRYSGRTNYTKDPYYTDGNRVVLILSDADTPADQIKYLGWEDPKRTTRTLANQ
jgi:hypothetical protein